MIVEVMERLSQCVPASWRLPAEIDLFGFYVTPILVVVPLGVVLAALSVWLIDRVRLTQYIWHPPLFLFSLTLIYGVTLSWLLMPI